MSTTKFAAGAASLVLVLSVGTAVREVRASRATDAALAAAQKSATAAVDRLREIEQQANDAQATQASLQSDLATAAPVAAPPAAAPASAPGFDPMPGRVAMRELEVAHPEVRRAMLEASKASLTGKYRTFFAALKLTPEQIEQFNAIMIDAQPIAWWGGMTRSSPLGTYRYSFAPTDNPIPESERDARLLQLLGPDGVRRLQEFNDTDAARGFATMVAQSAFDAGEPFTAGQSWQLAKIVAQSTAADATGKKPGLADAASAVLEQSRASFSGPQVAIVAAAIQQVQFNQALAGAAKDASSRAGGH